MLQTIPRWKITINFVSQHPMVLFYSDQHYANVLRTVANFDFEQPVTVVTVALVQDVDMRPNIATSTGSPYFGLSGNMVGVNTIKA